jgi:hypothetical protein
VVRPKTDGGRIRETPRGFTQLCRFSATRAAGPSGRDPLTISTVWVSYRPRLPVHGTPVEHSAAHRHPESQHVPARTSDTGEPSWSHVATRNHSASSAEHPEEAVGLPPSQGQVRTVPSVQGLLEIILLLECIKNSFLRKNLSSDFNTQ